MNNAVHPKATGGFHWLEYLPGYMYCFLPSFEADRGAVYVYDYLPDFLLDFLYCAEIFNVTSEPMSKQSEQCGKDKSNKKMMNTVSKSNPLKVHAEVFKTKKNSRGYMSQEIRISGNKSNQMGISDENKRLLCLIILSWTDKAKTNL